jgi:predicted Zn-dependent peptidase
MIDRKSAPPFAELSTYELPRVYEETLMNGLTVSLIGGVNQNVLKVELIFPASKWVEPEKGISYFTAHMLEKGTSSRSSFEISELLDKYGASIEINPGFDYTSISIYTLTKNLEEVLSLFLEIITGPLFDDQELMILKDIYIQNLKINNEKNSYLASKYFRQNLFGLNHPYGSSAEESDVVDISNDQLKGFYRKYILPQYAFITGNISDEIYKQICNYLSSLKVFSGKTIINHTTQSLSKSFDKDIPSRSQASLRIGKQTINRSHKDYPAFIMLNHILGGYFGSRLMKNIREEKGLTYGIYSSINALKHESFFVIGADVNKANKEIAIIEIKNELLDLRRNRLKEDEFIVAKNHLLGSLQLEISNPFYVAEKIKAVKLYELSQNFYTDLFYNILNLNSTQIFETANRYLSDEFHIISIG